MTISYRVNEKLELDAVKLCDEYTYLFGDEAFLRLAMNYIRFMDEHVIVQKAKQDHRDRGVCFGYLRVRPPTVFQKKKSDKKAV